MFAGNKFAPILRDNRFRMVLFANGAAESPDLPTLIHYVKIHCMASPKAWQGPETLGWK